MSTLDIGIDFPSDRIRNKKQSGLLRVARMFIMITYL